MTNLKQKIAILGVLSAICYLLFAICQYWLADVYYAAGVNAMHGFAVTQNTQYLQTALDKLSQSYKLNPDEPFIASELASVLAYFGETKTALALSDQALATSPHHPNFYKSRSRMLIILSELDLAAKTLQDAEKISPTDPRLPYSLGVIYKYLNATDSAKLAFQKALDLKSDFLEAKNQL